MIISQLNEHYFMKLSLYEDVKYVFIHPNHSSKKEEFNVILNCIGDLYDNDTTNRMVVKK